MTTEILVYALVLVFPAAHNRFFKLKTADQHIIADGLGVLVLMLDGLTRWTDDLGFLHIIC